MERLRKTQIKSWRQKKYLKWTIEIHEYSNIKKQGWEFAHLLIAHSLIRSFRSNQMSDCERFAQIAQDKWATVSKSLRSLRGNERSERIAHFAPKKLANEQFAQKTLAKKI